MMGPLNSFMAQQTEKAPVGSVNLLYEAVAKLPRITGMGLRRFVNEVLVLSPLVFLGCLTVQARTQYNYFKPAEYSPRLDRKIAAYIEPVRLVEEALARKPVNFDAEQFRKIGETWRNMTNAGFLVSLPPEGPGDSTRDGIKGQIRRAADELAANLQRIAEAEAAKGRFLQASRDATLSIEVLQGVKFSDLYAVGALSTRENAAVEKLAAYVAHIGPEHKTEIAERLEKVRANERPMAELVRAEQRSFFEAQRGALRNAWNQKRFELMIALAKEMDSGHSSTLSSRAKQLAKYGTVGEDMLVPTFRFAWNAHRNSFENWSRLETALFPRA
jgi:hypothetical protein